jgi:hypothetical protein
MTVSEPAHMQMKRVTGWPGQHATAPVVSVLQHASCLGILSLACLTSKACGFKYKLALASLELHPCKV